MEDNKSKIRIGEVVPSSTTLQFIIEAGKENPYHNEEVEKPCQLNKLNRKDVGGFALITKTINSDGSEKEDLGRFVESAASKVSEEFFKCDICDKSFESMNDLQSHANTIHLNLPPASTLPQSVIVPKVK